MATRKLSFQATEAMKWRQIQTTAARSQAPTAAAADAEFEDSGNIVGEAWSRRDVRNRGGWQQ